VQSRLTRSMPIRSGGKQNTSVSCERPQLLYRVVGN